MGVDLHARLEPGRPVDGRRRGSAAAEEVQRHAIGIERVGSTACGHRDVARRLTVERVRDDVGREVDAIEADAAALDGSHIGFTCLVIAVELPLAVAEEAIALKVVLETARQRIRLGGLLGKGIETDVLGRTDSAEQYRRDIVGGHRLLDAGGQERVAAIDRERSVRGRAGGLGKSPALPLCVTLRFARYDLAEDRQTVAKVMLEVGEEVLPARIRTDRRARDPVVHARAAVDCGAAMGVAGTAQDER